MTKRDYGAIHEVLFGARQIVQRICCPEYPKIRFDDADMEKLFFELNDLCMLASKKEEDTP